MSDQARPAAVLADLSRMYFFIRSLGMNQSLDYERLLELLRDAVEQTLEPRYAWTAWDRSNDGQSSFIGYVQKHLGFEVEAVEPREALAELAADTRSPKADMLRELVRFDTRIAYAIARLAEDRTIVVLSDSYSLAAPMLDACRRGWDVKLAWWGEGLDHRWNAHVYNGDDDPMIDFIDLSIYTRELFGKRVNDDRRVLDTLP